MLLLFYQFEQGNWSLFLLAIGPLPYGLGFLLSTLGYMYLLRRGPRGSARAAGLAFLIVGLPLAACGVLMLGST
jgi:hypothetical protein